MAAPDASRIILTHTRDEVQALNGAARDRLRRAGALGEDVTVATERGRRAFAAGDRIMFFRSERGLGGQNGTLGTVVMASPGLMAGQPHPDAPTRVTITDLGRIDPAHGPTIQ